MNRTIRPATPRDCLAIAEQVLEQPGQSLLETGAIQASSETANFSWRNATLACHGDEVAAMVLACRLPAAADNNDDPNNYPEFVRPLIELELCVPESFYVNMLAAYPRFRGQGHGSALATKLSNDYP